MSIGAVLAQIDALILAKVPGYTSAFGREKLGEQRFPPNIVWAPGDDGFAPARDHRFGNKTGASPVATPASQLPRSLHTRKAALHAFIWAKADDGDASPYADLSAAEELLRQAVNALRICCAGSYELTGGGFVDAEVNQLGSMYQLSFTIDVPIPVDTPKFATATVVNTTGSID